MRRGRQVSDHTSNGKNSCNGCRCRNQNQSVRGRASVASSVGQWFYGQNSVAQSVTCLITDACLTADPGVRCLTRAFCNVLWRFAMQRYVTIKRFVSLQNYSWAVSRKTFCETNHCISRALRSGLWAYLIYSSVF